MKKICKLTSLIALITMFISNVVFAMPSTYYVNEEVGVSVAEETVLEGNVEDLEETIEELELGIVETVDFNSEITERKYKIIVPKNGYIDIQIETQYHDGKELGVAIYLENENQEEHVYDIISSDYMDVTPITSTKIGLEAGTYTFTISTLSDFLDIVDHSIDIIVDHIENENFEIEDNDTLKTAQKISTNVYYGGISNEGSWTFDPDYYSFDLQSKTDIKISFLYSDVDNFFYHILRDENYDKIYDIDQNFNMVKEGEYYTCIIEDLLPGTYFIDVNSIYDRNEYEFIIETPDWNGHWAKNEIDYARKFGWINNSFTFRPNDAITRAEFVKIVNKAFGFTQKATSESFTDVNQNNWFYNEVLIAIEAGYISTKNSTFRPNEPITREEVASIITTIEGNKDSNLDKLEAYTDKHLVSKWALSSVEGAIEAGYMGKNSTVFNPKRNITRAEAVVTLYRVTR